MAAMPFTRQEGGTAPDAEPFREPIEFLYGEHERIRRLCQWLERLAGDPAVPEARETAAAVLGFLESDLALHRADEEEDLFPLLRRRSPKPPHGSHDPVIASLEVLEQEHRDDIEQGRTLRPALRRIAGGARPSDPQLFVHYVRAFTRLQRGHQTMENNLVLPAALERLTADDLAELGRAMAARRGVTLEP